MRLALTIVFLFISALPASALDAVDSRQARFRVVTVAGGLEHPWSVAFLPEGEFLVTERGGTLYRIAQDGKKTKIGGVPEVMARGQGGLLDVVLAPDFETSRMIYFSYAGGSWLKANTELARARLNLESSSLENVEVIFRADPKVNGGNHFGSRILFLPDGTLLLTLGERNNRDEAQNPENHLGTIVRLNPDGTIPDDNPYKGKAEFRPEIYSWGHRNVQGAALQPETGAVWAHEHGPKGGDEVNIIRPGANYGWPAISYGIDYTGLKITDKMEAPGMEQPVIYWVPSIAPSGMAFYAGDKFPQWKGDLFVGALVLTHLRRLEIDGGKVTDQEILLADMEERIRDVRSGPDGYIYLLTDSSEGRLLRLEPAL